MAFFHEQSGGRTWDEFPSVPREATPGIPPKLSLGS
jgi:hypothetical protein